MDYLINRIAGAENPRDFGKPLSGNKANFWRYGVRDYRIVCSIEDKRLVVLIVAVGPRSTVYEE